MMLADKIFFVVAGAIMAFLLTTIIKSLFQKKNKPVEDDLISVDTESNEKRDYDLRANLQNDLDLAVKEQRFEMAAKLRDSLKKLK